MHEEVIVGEAIAGRSAHVRKELARMVSSLNVSTFDMIVLLAEAQENGYAQQWGFSSLVEFGAKELGLKKRKTQYLARIGYVTKAVGLRRSQYESAGTSKLREITVLDPEGSYWNRDTHTNEDLAEHIVRLILDHDKMTVQQVHDEVLRLQGRTGPDRPVTKSYTVPKAAYDNVIKPAFELIRMKLGSSGRDAEGNALDYSDGVVLEMICANVLSDPNNQPEDDRDDDISEPLSIPMESET